ncbi:ABC transporter substrate-binding protein [uncultured Ilyobacter sp.]|uniref:ABC transporter substrate-binding protein n=1 Tax=uncultured Ilyobacter sp. TaxID=544433 RepID=UPI0029C9697C|nr:ABC transporter substrate-binding protein [uncultured Ilyobacter sp.]
MKRLITLILAMSVMVLAGCGKKEQAGEVKESKIKVGFAQESNSAPWRIAESESIKSEAEKRGYQLIFTNAEGQTAKQVSDIEDLIAQGVDYIVLAPREYEGLTPALMSAKEAGIPVILVDREAAGVPGEDYVTLIASDFVWEGEEAARWLAEQKEGKINIVELKGTAGSSVANDRSKGFRNIVDSNSNLEIVSAQIADFSRAEAQKVMTNIIQAKGAGNINAVYAHNDEMALGAIKALKAANIEPGKDVLVIGIDGQKDAVDAIKSGEMSATVTCSPFFGPATFDVIEKLEKGETVPTSIVNKDVLYDSKNVHEYTNPF